EDVDFTVWDISPRFCGGAFILDRTNRRYWILDRNFGVIGDKDFEPEFVKDDFQPVSGANENGQSKKNPADKFYFELGNERDPISIEALPDDSILILNYPGREKFSVIKRYFRERKLDDLKTDSILPLIEEGEDSANFKLKAYEIAFLQADETKNTYDRVYVMPIEGNQAFAFNLICTNDLQVSPALNENIVKKNFELQPVAEYYPIRLFGGKVFTSAFGEVYYDFGERFLPLVKQNRPSFEDFGIIDTYVFDGKEQNCVWHRLMLDGCIPPETSVEIYSRTAEQSDEIELSSWTKEPKLYLRGNGNEQPFSVNQTSREKGKGTWELLLQNAKNRYLQLRLVFSGNRQKTPEISALRVYYPRFSYLNNYLPAVYREDEQSAFFLDRFLSNFEGTYTAIEDRIAAIQMLFDVRSAPTDSLDWLANWFGVALDPAWNEEKRRLFIKHAVEFFQYRGTMRGIRIALRLILDSCADESVFNFQTSDEKIRDSVRLVEQFQTRFTPEIIPADSTQNLLRETAKTAKWQPNQGAGVLHQLYREKFEEETNANFPLIRPTDSEEAQIWDNFTASTLGFIPSSAAEHKNWQDFLKAEYTNQISQLNSKHSTNYGNFDEIYLPTGIEQNENLISDWNEFISQTAETSRIRKLWQDFLARRYRRIRELNSKYGTNWNSFDYVSQFDRLPILDKPLEDWFLFESSVLPMHKTAHRFTVLIPASLSANAVETAEDQRRKMHLVRRVVELEKPAHTVCEYRYYWNLFRVDEVRLGFDTLLGLGSRDPRLNPEMIVGESFVGESRIGTPQKEKYPIRYVLGSEILEKN
ncbi:MAG TPA: phage tail protein, partial [Pyrinomonadaceae bacterium]|nr:phage tail protein [Pyrinomonadaceae bacterium]